MTQLIVKATELHEQAMASFKVSERFAYDFIMKVKQIRDERLYKELRFSSFESYCESAWNVKRDYMDERILLAESFGEGFDGTYRQLGHSKSLLLARMEPEIRQKVESTVNVNESTVRELKEAQRRAEEAEQRAAKAEAAAIHNEKLWRQAQNQPPRIETRTIEKTPDDYQMLKEQSAVAQRLNTENVQLKRDLMRQREEYELKLTQEDKRKAINRDLKKNCQELLQNQGMYTESILYNLSLSMGEREAAQIIEAFQLQYSHDVQVFMNKLKQMTTVSAVS